MRAWAASASQQFSVSAVKRSGCGGGGAWQGSVTAVQSFRASAFPLRRPRCVPGQRQRRSSSVFQRLSVPAAAAAGRGWAALQQFSVSEFKRLSVAAAAAAGRGWAALQQFRVSGFERCCCPGVGAWAASASQQFRVSAVKRSGCGGGGAWLGSVAAVQRFSGSAFVGCGGRGAWLGSVAAVQSFRVSALSVAAAAARGVAGQRCSSSEFQGFSVPAAEAAVRAWAASASQQFSVSGFERCRCPACQCLPSVSVAAVQSFRVSAVKRSSCCGGGAWLGSVAAVQRFSGSAFRLRRPRCVAGQRCSSSAFQSLSI